MAKDFWHSIHNLLARSHQTTNGESGEENNLEEYYIPDYILLPESEMQGAGHVPACPVIVFVNSKSGGQLGRELITTYRTILNENQVFDLGEKAPDKVLHQLYFNLEKNRQKGDGLSSQIQRRLRIIVAGGDGSVGWLLGVISDLKLSHPPPVATMPLGTGNNIHFSFGWGKKNPGTDSQSVKAFLYQVRKAKEMMIDSWHILMQMRAPKEGSCDPIAPLELPNSLHAFQRVSHSDTLSEEVYHIYRGGFWNYFSMGMDAQVSYAFHTRRNLHPERFNNQLANQNTYAKLVCSQGWFCAPLFHPSSGNIAQLAKVRIMKRSGHWEDLHIPRSIRSIVCLNLPSFSGGLNPWGRPSRKKVQLRCLTPPYVDDGLLEVVGFCDAWHGLGLLTPKGHGTRLAQAHKIRFEFHKGAADHTYMRIDGEPWKQALPVDDDKVVVEISHFGQVSMLANGECRSKSIYAPPPPYKPEDGDCDCNEEDFEEEGEEWKKLGAADTFRMSDDAS